MCQSDWTAECRYRSDQLTGSGAETIQISCRDSTPGTFGYVILSLYGPVVDTYEYYAILGLFHLAQL